MRILLHPLLKCFQLFGRQVANIAPGLLKIHRRQTARRILSRPQIVTRTSAVQVAARFVAVTSRRADARGRKSHKSCKWKINFELSVFTPGNVVHNASQCDVDRLAIGTVECSQLVQRECALLCHYAIQKTLADRGEQRVPFLKEPDESGHGH